MTAPTPDAGGRQTTDDDGEDRVFTQAELNSLLAKQRREVEAKFEGFDEIKERASKYDELTEAAKTEAQKAAEQTQTLQKQLEEAQAELDWANTVRRRDRIAAEKGLDRKLWDRVKGETEEEITADVEELAGFAMSKPRPSPGGLRSGATGHDEATRKEQAVEALRNIREARR